MKKTHWLRNTLIVLLCCGIAGTAVAAVVFSREENRSYAAATLQYSFNGAGEGKAPSGNPFDANGIASEEVIQAALEASGLAEKYTAEQIAENLDVTGVYPENIVNQMTQYVSLLNTTEERDVSVSSYHATIYQVRLYSDFDPSVSGGELKGLLNNLLDAYRNWFRKTSSASTVTSDPIPDPENYDIAHRLTALMQEVSQQRRYAEEMAALAPDFLQDKTGFSDIAIQDQSLYAELQRAYAVATVNVLSRDPERLRKQYEEMLWELSTRAEKKQEELRQIEKLVESYQKDSVIYISTAETLEQISSDTGAYDQLSARRDGLTAELTTLQKTAADYEGLLADLAAAEGTEPDGEEPENRLTEAERQAQTAALEEQIAALTVKKETVTTAFAGLLQAYTDREVNEKTVSVYDLKYKAPTLFSFDFLKTAIKTAGPLCALGLMVCLGMMVRGRRKTEVRGKGSEIRV